MDKITKFLAVLGVLSFYSSVSFSYLYETETSIDPHESQIKKFTEILPGEQIDLHTGEVGHYLETINIKGNGLPIRLGHRFHGELGYDIDIGRMSLEVPRLEFIHMGEPSYLGWEIGKGDRYTVVTPYKTNIHCPDMTLPSDAEYRWPYYESNPDPIPQDPNSILRSGIKIKLGYKTIDFFPKSHDPSNRFPASAIYISPANWYIECVSSPNVTGNNAFKAVSPEGLTYIFDIYQEAGIHEPLLTDYPAIKNPETKIYVSSVSDKYGNWLKYEYERYDASEKQTIDVINSWTLLYYRSRIKSISAKDGRKLNITYGSNSIVIQSNSTNPVKLIYSSSNKGDRLRITRKDGRYWEYNYIKGYLAYHYGKVIQDIKYPNGLKVSYTYKPRDRREYLTGGLSSGALSHFKSALKKRVVSGPNLNTLTEYYTYSGNTTFVKSPLESIEYKFSKIDYQKDPLNTPVSVGKLIRKSIYPIGTAFNQRGSVTPLKRISYSYTRVGKVIDLNYLKDNWKVSFGFSYDLLPVEVMTSTHASFLTDISTITTQMNGYTFTTRKSNYDAWGNPRTITENNTLGKARTTTRSYHYDTANWIVGQLASEYVNEANPVITTFSYYPTGKLKEKVLYANSGHEIIKHYTYHADGNLYQLLMYKSGSLLPKKTYWDYYRGIARWERDGSGNQKRTEVYDYGKIRSETDFNGHQPTIYEYDAMHRLVKIIPPIESATTISWPTLTKKITTKGGYRQTIDYNGLMKPVLITEQDTSRGEIRYHRKRYDAAGRLVYAALPSSNSNDPVGKQYTYDSLGRITSTKHTGDGGITTYCHGSKCGAGTRHGVLVTNARGYKQVWNFTAYGNPDEKRIDEIRQQKNLSSSNYVVTRIILGHHFQTLSIAQGGVTRSFTYKPGTLLLNTKTEPEIGVTRYLDYDERGNLLQKKIGNSGITIYSYDDDDKIDFIDYPGSTDDVDYQYKRQNVWRIITGNNRTVWTYSYDEVNKIKSESLAIDGLTFNISYSYDNLGNIDYMRLPRIENPSSSRIVDLTVDAFGRTRNISGYVSNIDYYPNDIVSGMFYENGYSYMSTLDERRRPNNIFTTDIRQDLIDLTYSYDRHGNVINISDGILSGNNRSMSYDGLDRLISANGRWGIGSISYSDSNDIQSMRLGGKILNYAYGPSQRLDHISGSVSKSFQYDVYGNITNNGSDRFGYDDASQLLAVLNKNIHYTYDGNKRRVKVESPNKRIYYVYNKAGELLYRYDALHKKDVEYINLNGKLLAKLENGPSITATIIIDTDNDGLSDADELAWGTDPNNPDTDGDSIKDGDEVAQGRNPLVVEIPPVPTGLSSPSSDRDGSFTVNWNTAPTATRYQLQQKTSGNWMTIYTGDATSKYRSRLYPATYYFRVKSCNSGGCSGYSSAVETQVYKRDYCKFRCGGILK